MAGTVRVPGCNCGCPLPKKFYGAYWACEFMLAFAAFGAGKSKTPAKVAGALEVGGRRKPTSIIRSAVGDSVDVGAADADIVQLAVGEITQFL